MSSEDAKSTIVDVLLKKYSLLKEEIWLNNKVYREHTKYFQILLTGLLVLFSAAWQSKYDVFRELWFWVVVAALVTTLMNYVAFHVLEEMYSIILLSARMAVLERALNKAVGSNILFWESQLVERLFASKRPLKGIVNPNYVLLWIQGVLGLLVIFAVPTYCFVFWDRFGKPGGTWSTLSFGLCILYSIGSAGFYYYVTKGILSDLRQKAVEWIETIIKEQADGANTRTSVNRG